MKRTPSRFALLIFVATSMLFTNAAAHAKDYTWTAPKGDADWSTSSSSSYLATWGVDTATAPSAPALVKTGSGFLLLTGSNSSTDSGTLDFTAASPSMTSASIAPDPGARLAPIPKDPVFYIIVEGAGLGDSVRTAPCTGSETVLSAVGAMNGISQVSSGKMWIARPSAKGDKSTILNINWENISRRGINTTNYTLQPGDRLVFGEDPMVTKTNLVARANGTIERASSVVGLTSSTIQSLGTPGAAQAARLLVRKGVFDDDPELKLLVQEMIPLGEERGKKPDTNTTPALTAGKTDEKSSESGGALVMVGSGTFTLSGAGNKLSAADSPSHEKAMRPLPDYVIESPDVIAVEMLKLIPLPPYRAAVYDVLKIRANAPADAPLDTLNYYMIEADGRLNLGPPWGSVKVEGMTLDEARKALNKHLDAEGLKTPDAVVDLARVAGAQPVTGQYLVSPDGTINLRTFGQVVISGKTVPEARAAIEKQLAKFLRNPVVSVDVQAFNSKVYYVITQGAGLGDSVRRLPVTGHETVLDAISQINGLSQVSDSRHIWVARPSALDHKTTILSVDWNAITRRGATSSNYQLMPGDRVYIGEDALLTRANLLSKQTAPIERAEGIISLTSSTMQSLNAAPVSCKAVKELVQKGVFDDDPELKRTIQELIRLGEEEAKKTAAKPAE